MRWWGRFLPLVLLTLAVLLNPANAQSKPSPEKHEAAAAVSSEHPKQDDQAALRTTLIAALQAIANQEKAAAKQASAENESWFSIAFVQRGLLVVGIIYSFFVCKQWLAMRASLQVSERAYVNVSRIEMIAPKRWLRWCSRALLS
jgi:hypothetical protein